MRRKRNNLCKWLTASILVMGMAVPIYGEGAEQTDVESIAWMNEAALQAYASTLSQDILTWGTETVESSGVQFASADLNGDGIQELMIYAPNAPGKWANDGYYELWSWQDNSLLRSVNFPHYLEPVSYDPSSAMVQINGVYKTMHFYELYHYENGHLSEYLDYIENPEGYGSNPATSYYNAAGESISQRQYLIEVSASIGDGSGMTPFVFYDNTAESRQLYLGSDFTAEAPSNITENTPTEISVSHSYQVFVENCTWTEAAERCASMGGYLAQINDVEEFYRITALLESSDAYQGKVFYLGGQRMQSDSRYFWTDLYGNATGDAPLNTPESWAYTYWGPGEPSYEDKGVPEMYLGMFKYNGTWILNDEPHSMLDTAPEYDGYIGYICEFEATSAADGVSMETVLYNLPSMYYGSGVGAWGTELTIASDGSFTGLYHDTDSGYSFESDGYSAIYYNCAFSGQFTNLRQINDFIYAMDIAWMDKWMDDSWSDPYVKFEFEDYFGLEAGDQVYLYLPGIPSAMTEPGYQDWIWMPKAWQSLPEVLDFYGLYDLNEDTSFIS